GSAFRDVWGTNRQSKAPRDPPRYSNAPSAVPRVFVKISVVPESRIGMYHCRTSIVRLKKVPRTTVATTVFRLGCPEEKNMQKKNPKGINPAILMKTSRR